MAGKRAKMIAERDRQRKREEAAAEEQALAANFKRLQGLRGGFARRVEKPEDLVEVRKKIKAQQKTLTQHAQFGTRFDVNVMLPAKVDPPAVSRAIDHRHDPELAERERLALERTEQMKKQVVPAYHKGGYQYLTGQDWEDHQKGLSRRRT